MTRKEAREDAFILLFEYSFHAISMEETIVKVEEYRKKLSEFTIKSVLGVENNLEAIDDILSQNLSGWSKERISKVALAVLRLSLFELLYNIKEVPVNVSINEAVELAKKYAGEEDPAFINGVLGSVNREIELKKDIKSE